MDEDKVKQLIKEVFEDMIKNDRYVFDKNIQILNARDIQTGRTNGTTIATATDQKIGFHGSASIQGVAIEDPSGGATSDTEARNAIFAILDVLQAKGIIST